MFPLNNAAVARISTTFWSALISNLVALVVLAAVGGFPPPTCASETDAENASHPNIVIVMSDDQGYGDLGVHGNSLIETPHLDRLARESAHLEHFYVSPVCTPTRASLMTGRYNYRTGAIDTYLGRAMMHPDETTLAEMLRTAGYRTGIFGKWHLGDNHPLRAIDQGFEEAVVHRGGGIGQPADPPGNRYFDPLLQHNGRVEQYRGYASDIFTTAAIDFIRRPQESPFFVYLAFNCPHTPLQIADDYVNRYRGRDFAAIGADRGQQASGPVDADTTARIYGMVTNIDDNIGRLMQAIAAQGLDENTIIIFLTDNGPQQNRYTAGLRGRKGTVYEGGIRVPSYVRWQGRIAPSTISQPAAHIDLTPTLLEACGAKVPEGLKLDGLSLLSLLTGRQNALPERQLFFQWHRGNEPQLHRAFAVRGPRYKLVQAEGAGDSPWPAQPKYELFDIVADPREQTDLASKLPDVVAQLRADYERWFADVSATRGYAPPRIHVGTPFENPVILTRQDWRGPSAGWNAQSVGHWELHVAARGAYDIRIEFAAADAKSAAHLKVGETQQSVDVSAGERSRVFQRVQLEAGPTQLEAWLESEGTRRGVEYVEISPSR